MAPNVKEKLLTCIRCPLGCSLSVRLDDGRPPEVSGNECARGARYGADEATSPLRTVTACVTVPGALEPLSVKTSAPIPRHKVREVAQAIAALKVKLPVSAGQVLAENLAGTEAAAVATKSLGPV